MANNSNSVRWPERCGAFLFTIVGGYLDAYSYIAHGVFANAQTGNIVMLAADLTQERWVKALQHLVPILTFSAGILVVTLLDHCWKEQTARLRFWSAVAEVGVLSFILLFEARLPKEFVVPMISFAVAVQITSFGSLGSVSFNSGMTTGNLRKTLSALGSALTGQEVAKNRETFLTLGAVCLCFLLGAFTGGSVTVHHPTHSLVAPLLGIIAAAALSMMPDDQRPSSAGS